MAPSLGRKNLLCFYCNKKSGIRYDGLITQWECARCNAVNFLDRNGEITDPPVATEHASSTHLESAYLRADSLPPQRFESDLFCSTCLMNQHLYRSSLAQYHVETDRTHPDYRKSEAEFHKFRDGLEIRYPSVCEDCWPKVEARLLGTKTTAKTDYLGKLMEKSRGKRSQGAQSKISLLGIVLLLGKILWHIGLLGQISWDIAGLAASSQYRLPATVIIYIPPYITGRFEVLISIFTSSGWAWSSLMCSLISLWWNPMYKQMHNGFMTHIQGTEKWYKFQAILLFARGLFYTNMGTGVLADASSPATQGAHLFMLLYVTTVYLKARRSLKVDLTSLWNWTPKKPVHIGPGSRASTSIRRSVKNSNTMFDALDEISVSPSQGRQLSSVLPVGQMNYGQEFDASSHTNAEPSIHLARTRGNPDPPGGSSSFLNSSFLKPDILQSTIRDTSLSRMNNDSLSPSDISSEDQMDWEYVHSQHRAFQPVEPSEGGIQRFGQTPVAERSSVFWAKVPPPPITPAHRLRNPPNKPSLRVSSAETKENFFKSVTRQSLDEGESLSNKITNRHDVDFASPRFYSTETPTDPALLNLLDGFSLKETPSVPNPAEKNLKARHACQGLFLLLSLFFWNQAFSRPSEYSKVIILAVMVGCTYIGARTILDNTMSRDLQTQFQQRPLAISLATAIGGVEVVAAGYLLQDIIAGSGGVASSSIGTIMIGSMVVYEIWIAAFGN